MHLAPTWTNPTHLNHSVLGTESTISIFSSLQLGLDQKMFASKFLTMVALTELVAPRRLCSHLCLVTRVTLRSIQSTVVDSPKVERRGSPHLTFLSIPGQSSNQDVTWPRFTYCFNVWPSIVNEDKVSSNEFKFYLSQFNSGYGIYYISNRSTPRKLPSNFFSMDIAQNNIVACDRWHAHRGVEDRFSLGSITFTLTLS